MVSATMQDYNEYTNIKSDTAKISAKWCFEDIADENLITENLNLITKAGI